MNIWIVEIGEPLPMEDGARLLRYARFAPYLVKQGHRVSWIACNFSHAPKAHIVAPYSTHDYHGVEIHCLPGPGYERNISLRRIRHHIYFARELKRHIEERLQRDGKPDLVVVPLPTIENMDVLSRFCQRHDIPYIVDIRDDWPEYFIIKLPAFLRPLVHFIMAPSYNRVKKACRRAAGVCGSSLAQLRYGLKMAGRQRDEKRDFIFYHGYAAQSLPEDKLREARAFWKGQGLAGDSFVLCFIGTLGFSVALDVAVEAVSAMNREGMNIQLVICGRGGQYGKFKEIARNRDDIIVPGWVDAAQIQALMQRSDIGLIPYLPVANMSMPNKIFEYMAGGLTIMSSCGGEGVALFNDYDFGLNYDHNDMNSFRKIIYDLYNDPARLSAMQANARRVFEEKFSYDVLYPAMESYMAARAGLGKD